MKFIMLNGVRYDLLKLRIEDMDDLLADPETRDLIGHPVYFDAHDRLWPAPENGIKVQTENA